MIGFFFESVGIVTTTRVTHATPAGLFGHVADRDWESFDGKAYTQAIKDQGCKDLAVQLIEDHSQYIDVIFAGGRVKFMSKNDTDPFNQDLTGDRIDGRNLIDEWEQKMKKLNKKYKYVWNYESFKELKPNQYTNILGLLAHNHMDYEYERRNATPINQPSLIETTRKAIELLSTNPNGYFLLSEGIHQFNINFNI